MSLDQFLLSSDTTDLNYPEVRPTLDLNFARVKALDPRITFTRASGGSYVGADGLIKLAGVNEARFDHNPVTGESLGFLVEESRTNLLLRSQDLLTSPNLSAAGLSNFFTATADALPSPSGSTNETVKFVSTSTTSEGLFLRQGALSLTATTYTVSMYVYVPTQVGISNWSMNFDYSDSLVDFGTTSVSTVFDRWVRVSLTTTLTSTRIFLDFNIRINGTNSPTTAGFTLYAWGAQLEAGAFPTSYIPTVASTRTRASDDASITGKNFSSFYNQSEGSILCNGRIIKINPPTYGQIFWAIGDSATFNESMYLVNEISTSAITYNLFDNNSNQFNAGSSTITGNSFNKSAVAIKLNDSAASFNGSTPSTDTSCTLPTVNILKIGNASWGTLNPLNGTIARLTYYSKRLTNQQLQALTR